MINLQEGHLESAVNIVLKYSKKDDAKEWEFFLKKKQNILLCARDSGFTTDL